jgi:hypothetical protein
MAHTRCMLDKQSYMHARVCTRLRAHTHTQTNTYTYCFSVASMIRERASMVRYTYEYIACLVCLLLHNFYI